MDTWVDELVIFSIMAVLIENTLEHSYLHLFYINISKKEICLMLILFSFSTSGISAVRMKSVITTLVWMQMLFWQTQEL